MKNGFYLAVLFIALLFLIISCAKEFSNPLDPAVDTPPSLWYDFQQGFSTDDHGREDPDNEFKWLPVHSSANEYYLTPGIDRIKLQFGLSDPRDRDVSIKIDFTVIHEETEDTVRIFERIYNPVDDSQADSVYVKLFSEEGLALIIPDDFDETFQYQINTEHAYSVSFFAYDSAGHNVRESVSVFFDERPLPAIAVYPEDEAEDVPVVFTFQWEYNELGLVPDGYKFNYWVATAEEPVLLDLGNVKIYHVANLNYNTDYNWKVVPYIIKTNGEREFISSELSSGLIGKRGERTNRKVAGYQDAMDCPVWTFTTGASTEPQEPPLPATAIYPTDNEMNVSIDTMFIWEANADGTAPDGFLFNYWLSTTEQPELIDVEQKTNYVVEGLLYESEYNWQVVPYIIVGDEIITAEDCPVWKFTTEDVPEGLYSLTLDIVGVGGIKVDNVYVEVFPYVTYIGEDLTVTLLAVEIEHWNFEKWIINGAEETEKEVVFTMESNIEAVAHFRQTAPAPAINVYPADGAYDIEIDLTLEWAPDDSGIAPDGFFFGYWVAGEEPPELHDLEDSTTYQVTKDLLYKTEYNWQVVPYILIEGEVVATDNCPVWTFTTLEELHPPAVPILLSPEDGETDVSLTPEFQWHPAENAEFYSLQLADHFNFTGQTIIVDVSNITETEYALDFPVLEENVTHYWRVKAHNTSYESEWSHIWSFTTREELTVYTLTIDIEGEGSVEIYGYEIIEFPYTDLFVEGAEVLLNALPANDWLFEKWVIDYEEIFDDETMIVITGYTYATAYFVLAPPLPAEAIYPENEAINVEVEPVFEWQAAGTGPVPEGYLFNYWVATEDPPELVNVGDSTSYQIQAPDIMLYETEYNWQVVPYIIDDGVIIEAVNCPLWSFTTVVEPDSGNMIESSGEKPSTEMDKRLSSSSQ